MAVEVRLRKPQVVQHNVILVPIELGTIGNAEKLSPNVRKAPQMGTPSLANILSTTQLWEYSLFLFMSLLGFTFYLLLPKGFRKAYFRADRRRFSRYANGHGKRLKVKARQDKSVDISIPRIPRAVESKGSFESLDSNFQEITDDRRSPAELRSPPPVAEQPPLRPHGGSSALPVVKQPPGTSLSFVAMSDSPTINTNEFGLSTISHPAIAQPPSSRILSEALSRLEGNGMRLLAHGIQCDARKVWIRYVAETTSLTWQTEFQREITNSSGESSNVWLRGAVHAIPLPNIVYIDVGKKTSAFQRSSKSVPAFACFSLLTANGSLDLQANSRLERDAVVCCLSYLLDRVHSQDWRRMYEESPEPSQILLSSDGSSTLLTDI